MIVKSKIISLLRLAVTFAAFGAVSLVGVEEAAQACLPGLCGNKRLTQSDTSLSLNDYKVGTSNKIELILPGSFNALDSKSQDALNQLEMAFTDDHPKIADRREGPGLQVTMRSQDVLDHPLLSSGPVCIRILPEMSQVKVKNKIGKASVSSRYSPQDKCILWSPQKKTLSLDLVRRQELNLQVAYALLHRMYGSDFPEGADKIWYDLKAAHTEDSNRGLGPNSKAADLVLDEDVVFFKSLARFMGTSINSSFIRMNSSDLAANLFFAPKVADSRESLVRIYSNDDGTYFIRRPVVWRSQSLKNEYLALQAMGTLLETRKFSLDDERDKLTYGGVIQVGFDSDLLEAVIRQKPKSFKELADAVEVVRPESGTRGQEWYNHFFQGDEKGEHNYPDQKYDTAGRKVPATDPQVAFVVRLSDESEKSEEAAFANIVSDENLPKELAFLREHLKERKKTFDEFRYEGFRLIDGKHLLQKLQTNQTFLDLRQDQGRLSKEANRIHEKLTALTSGFDYESWFREIVMGRSLFGDASTIKDVEIMKTYRKLRPKTAYHDLADMELPQRVEEYKKILKQHQTMEEKWRWIPYRFPVLVELYKLCGETDSDFSEHSPKGKKKIKRRRGREQQDASAPVQFTSQLDNPDQVVDPDSMVDPE